MFYPHDLDELSFPLYYFNLEPNLKETDSICFEKAFQNIFPMIKDKEEELSISNGFEKKSILVEKKNHLNNGDFSKTLFASKNDIDNLTLSSIKVNEEFNHILINDINYDRDFPEDKIFKVVYPKKDSLFTNVEKNPASVQEEIIFLRRKRLSDPRIGKDRLDNIRTKVKRGFYNALTVKLNEKIKKIGIKNEFAKFPDNLVKDVNKKRGTIQFNMTLDEYMRTKHLYIYKKDEKSLEKYEHNLKILDSGDVKNNEDFKNILNKTIHELYEEYINSDEFKKEIDRLKNNKKEKDEYINTYKYIANHLSKFFSN